MDFRQMCTQKGKVTSCQGWRTAKRAETMIKFDRRKPHKIISLAWVVLAIAGFARANPSGFSVFDGKTVAAIAYDRQADVPIQKAAALLSHDLTAVDRTRARGGR
jgi:hypothetical protein